MSDFDLLAGFYGILLGLIIAEVAVKFADAIDSHAKRPIGLLTPMLAILVLFDVSSFWMWLWSERSLLMVTWTVTLVSMVLGIVYFLAAALIFPRDPADWTSLDAHYWARKRWVLGGLLFTATVVLGQNMMRLMPAWSDVWFFYWQGAYFLPLVALFFSRNRRLDLALMTFLLAYWALGILSVLPDSDWANRIGANGTRASTIAVAPPK